jgi:hypothetical protein
MTDPESLPARRYLLGEANDEERMRVERQYFADAGALERMEAAEEELIEDYVADRLSSEQRAQFERAFLSVPHRRARVATIRALMRAASADARVPADNRSAPARAQPPLLRRLSLAAAAILLIAAGTWWVFGVSRGRPTAERPQVAESSAPAASAPAARSSPRVFAVSISPSATRSAGEAGGIAVPDGTDRVELRLEAEPGDARVERARAVVRTVTGDEIWRGPAATPSDLPPGIAARVDLPAAQLRPDDYVITLFTATPSGVEREAYRYFLRVLAR